MTHHSKLAEWLGSELPKEYRDYLHTVDGRETLVGDVLFYDASSLIERNETYEVKAYCPGHFTVGDDGGGRAVVIRIADGSVLLVDHGAMTPDCMRQLSLNFRDWLAAGCPLPDEDQFSTENDRLSQLVLVNAGTANSATIAKELRRALSISLSEALTLARGEKAILMDSNRYTLQQMDKCRSNLATLGAVVTITRAS